MSRTYFILGGAATIFLLLGKNSRASSSQTKYVPPKQNNFTPKMREILPKLEEKLNCPYLSDFLLTVSRVESRGYPSAIRYEPGMGYHPNRFPQNPYRNYPYLWQYTGGLFQMFPYIALETYDNSAHKLDPRLVFNPYCSIAFAIDFAYRLHKKYNAERWIEIRFGWRSLKTLQEKPIDIGQEIQNRMINAAEDLNINPGFLYNYPNFSVYENNYQFAKLVKYILANYS